MQIEQLSAFAAIALAGSLAMERLVVIAKTTFPWLAEAKTAGGQSEMRADRWRRRAVLAITLAASFVTSWLLSDSVAGQPRYVSFGEGSHVHWTLFAFTISGGSAFWTSVVSYASTTKDLRAQEKANLIEAREQRRALPSGRDPKVAPGI